MSEKQNMKRKSPFDFFAKGSVKSHFKKCDYPGCEEEGEFKAPKSRTQIREYYWFCLNHVKDYNKSWNYFEGMSDEQVDLTMRQSLFADRPTWNQTARNIKNEDVLKRIFDTFGETDDSERQKYLKEKSPELKALLDLGLQPPISFKAIKKRYRKLVKQYHPDVNQSDPAMNDKIKKINNSFQLLKKVYNEK